MPSTRSPITAASLRAFALARGDEVVQHRVEQRQRLGAAAPRDPTPRDLQHAGELQQVGELGAQAGEARRAGRSASAASCADQRLVDAAAPRRASAARRRSVRSSLPRDDPRRTTRSRSAGSSARSSSGRRRPSLEETVVHRAQLAGKRAPCGGCARRRRRRSCCGSCGHPGACEGANGNLAPPSISGISPWPLPPSQRPQRRTSCAPCRIQRGFTRHAEGSVLVELRRHPRAVHRQRREQACRRSCAARARAGSPPSTACCRAPPTPAATARPRAASRAGARWRSSA